jgi:hypothetical protein
MSMVTARLRLVGVVGLGIAVLAAAARPLNGEITLGKAFVVLAIVLPAAVAPALLVRYAEARRWMPFFLLGTVVFILATAAVGLLATKVPVGPLKSKGSKGPNTTGGGSGLKKNPTVPEHSHFTISTGMVVVLLLLLALVIGGAIVLAIRRKPPASPVAAPRKLVPEADAAELVRRFYSLIDDTLDDLRAEPDPRRAVIAAYARMEHGLGTLGIERLLSETPFEYLARVLERLSVSDQAARALTDLFLRAKFSAAPVTDAMKEEAVSSLETIREEARAWAA